MPKDNRARHQPGQNGDPDGDHENGTIALRPEREGAEESLNLIAARRCEPEAREETGAQKDQNGRAAENASGIGRR
jgi:hypothetical protein